MGENEGKIDAECICHDELHNLRNGTRSHVRLRITIAVLSMISVVIFTSQILFNTSNVNNVVSPLRVVDEVITAQHDSAVTMFSIILEILSGIHNITSN